MCVWGWMFGVRAGANMYLYVQVCRHVRERVCV